MALNTLFESPIVILYFFYKNPEFSFKFFSIFWEIGDDRLVRHFVRILIGLRISDYLCLVVQFAALLSRFFV